METRSILGIKVHKLNRVQFNELVQEDLYNNQKKIVFAINPEKIIKAQKSEGLADVLKQADYCIPDGIGVVLAYRLLHKEKIERITGIGCMEMLCRLAADKGYGIFLMGAKPNTVLKTKTQLEADYDGLKVVGYSHGFETDDSVIVERIRSSRPSIVFVAMGSPKQEYWIYKHCHTLPAAIFLGVGGSFDVISGETKRAPVLFQKAGLEWLYRGFAQPKRMKRQTNLVNYMWLIGFEYLRKFFHTSETDATTQVNIE